MTTKQLSKDLTRFADCGGGVGLRGPRLSRGGGLGRVG